MNPINALVDDFYKFLRQKTTVNLDNVTNWTQITTPFLGLFNDSIEIYVKKEKEKLILSDDGETIHNLELSGVSLSRSAKRKDILESILLNYGVTLNKDSELTIEANEKSFPQKKLNLLAAISEANDLYVLSKQTVESVFKEEVQSYLEEQRIIYTPHFISKGSTGLEFTFDFQIAYYHTEIVIKAFNTVNKMNLPHFLFTWSDIQQVRERQSGKRVIGLAIINDTDREVKSEYLEALTSKEADYILWENRHAPGSICKLKAVNE
ncbi:MAG: DUF1828 domain-containing protein [Candidatus Cloacimonadaceae bacterium]|nr:DUF1828 domain-containing protein [Candidatus Cloacimonadaceae bacterium]